MQEPTALLGIIAALAVGDPAKMDCPYQRYADKLGVPLQEISLEKIP